MTSPLARHRKLVQGILQEVDAEDLRNFKNVCREAHIRKGELSTLTNVQELIDKLQSKGKFDLPSKANPNGYKELKKLFEECENHNVLKLIKMAEKDIMRMEMTGADSSDEDQDDVPTTTTTIDYPVQDRRRQSSDSVFNTPSRKRMRLSRTLSDADSDNSYPVSVNSERLLVIIDQFTNDRIGGIHDIKPVIKFFDEQLNFKCVIKRDLSKENFLSYLEELSNGIQQSPRHDMLFVFVFSHGDEHGIKTCIDSNQVEPDGYITTEDLVNNFRASKLPKMAGRPKVFVVQACKGVKEMNGIATDNTLSTKRSETVVTDNGGHITIPEEADILLAFATTQGHVAFRDTENGSWFVQHLINVFREQYSKEHLLDMLTEVNYRVSKECNNYGKKQIPCLMSTLTKKLFINSVPSP